MALVQNPILKYWAEDSANVKSLTQSDIGNGIVLQSDIYSNEVNAAEQYVWKAVQYLQHTGGLYSPLVPYTNPDVVSVLTYNGGIYSIGQYVRLTTNPGSTTNNPPITGATISTVNGIDVYSGGLTNPDWYLTSSPLYDLIIDSDAKLATWANVAATGTYTRVLIKTGTWNFNAATNTKVSGQGVNLTDAGTKQVFGEYGAILNITNLTVTIGATSHCPALFYSSLPGRADHVCIKNLKIITTGSGSTGFANCLNINNCITETLYGSMYNCYSIYDCWANRLFDACGNIFTTIVDMSTGTGYNAYGFQSCNFLDSCFVYGTVATDGYVSCSILLNCNVILNRSLNGTLTGYHTCSRLTQCFATVTNSYGSGTGIAFYNSIILNGCGATVTANTAKGFSRCKRMSFNSAVATTKYDTCYVDSGTTYGITASGEDTPDGGWNI